MVLVWVPACHMCWVLNEDLRASPLLYLSGRRAPQNIQPWGKGLEICATRVDSSVLCYGCPQVSISSQVSWRQCWHFGFQIHGSHSPCHSWHSNWRGYELLLVKDVFMVSKKVKSGERMLSPVVHWALFGHKGIILSSLITLQWEYEKRNLNICVRIL